MKKQADKHRSERVFAEGDQVYLKVQPYLQHSLADRRNQKLSLKFYGPYEVLRRVGAVSYQLALPAGSRIHDVIHVSQLKKQVPPAQVVATDSHNPVCSLSIPQPAAILQSRFIQSGGKARPRLKVRWTNSSAAPDTWENAFVIHQRYPTLTAWGQAAPQGAGSVMQWPRPGRRPKASRRCRHLDRAWRATCAKEGPDAGKDK